MSEFKQCACLLHLTSRIRHPTPGSKESAASQGATHDACDDACIETKEAV